jgi:glucose/arabinose dehydrogenase
VRSLPTARLIATLLVLASAAPAARAQDYQVPPDNPFVNTPGAAPEVFALGLRNPWRFTFDRLTGDLFIGDVGGAQREEIDWIAMHDARGANFGWPCREGSVPGPGGPRCMSPPPPYVEPLADYIGQAVTVGYVVRDPALTGLTGRLLYADFYPGTIRSLALNRTAPDDTPTGETLPNLASFGEDASGRLYVANLDAGVRRLTPGSSPGTLTSTPIAGPWDQPIAIATVPGDPNRLLVAERPGRVRLVVDGAVRPGSMLEIPDPPGVSSGGERGLLSVAAAPDWQSSGKLYVYFTDAGGDIRIEEYTRSPGNPEDVDEASRRPLLTLEHSSEGNHNGGQLQFGPDGCLWITTGDGGGQNDQHDNAQNLATHLGKILRIDPNPADGVCALPTASVVPDTTAPVLRARVPARQRVLRLRGAVAYARCNESCSLAAGGRLRIGRRSYLMRTAARSAQAGRRVRVKVGLTTRGRRALKRRLRRGRPASVRLTLRATDAAGNRSAPVRRRVRVRR